MELLFVVDTTRLLVAAPPFLNKQPVASQPASLSEAHSSSPVSSKSSRLPCSRNFPSPHAPPKIRNPVYSSTMKGALRESSIAWPRNCEGNQIKQPRLWAASHSKRANSELSGVLSQNPTHIGRCAQLAATERGPHSSGCGQKLRLREIK